MRKEPFIILAVLLATFAWATLASANESRWAVRGYGGYLPRVSDSDTDGYTFAGLPSEPINASADWEGDLGSTSAFGLGVEYRITEHRLGVELSGMFANIEGNLTGTANIGPFTDLPLSEKLLVNYTPVYLGPNVHLLKKDWPVDLYLGGFGVWTRFGESSFTVLDMPVDFSLSNQFGWGLSAGLDATLGKTPWMISAGVRALTSDSRIAIDLGTNNGEPLVDPVDFEIYPLTVLAGIGYRF